MNPVRVMAHQTAGYPQDHQRYSGACAGVGPRAYAAQRLVNSHDTRVYASLRSFLITAICHLARKERWKKVPAGTYDRLILCVVLEHACAGPGWSKRERARQCEMPLVEFRRYHRRYEEMWRIMGEWLDAGYRQILLNEIRAKHYGLTVENPP